MLRIDDDLWQAPLESNSIYNKKVRKNRDKYFPKESNSGLSKEDKDYLMGVIKSIQQVIEIQSSIIKNNQIKNVIDVEPTEITENKEKVKEEKRTELNQDEIEILTKEIIKGTRNIINNIVKNLNK